MKRTERIIAKGREDAVGWAKKYGIPPEQIVRIVCEGDASKGGPHAKQYVVHWDDTSK